MTLPAAAATAQTLSPAGGGPGALHGEEPARRPRRRIPLAARRRSQVQAARDPALPRGRERLHGRHDGAAAVAAGAARRRDAVAHPGRRQHAAGLRPRLVVLARIQGRRRIPGADASARQPRTARRARAAPGAAGPGRRWPRARPTSTSAPRRSAPTARSWPGPKTPAAAASTRCAFATCAPGRPSPTRSPACWKTWPGPATAARCSTCVRIPVTLQSGPVWRHTLGTDATRRREGVRGGRQDAVRIGRATAPRASTW